MPKTNAATLVDNAPAEANLRPAAFIGDQPENAVALVQRAMESIAAATDLPVYVPSNTDDAIDVEQTDEDGQVHLVRCRVVNRYGRLQRNLLDNVLRSLDFSIERGQKDIEETKRDLRSAMSNLQRSQDPTKLMDFIDTCNNRMDYQSDAVAHAQLLRDGAADTYFAIVGKPYVPYEKRERKTVEVAAPAAVADDPRIARAKALLGAR